LAIVVAAAFSIGNFVMQRMTSRPNMNAFKATQNDEDDDVVDKIVAEATAVVEEPVAATPEPEPAPASAPAPEAVPEPEAAASEQKKNE